jgi:phage repressor protein C with HTH and peptisase S24 domain
MEHAASPDDIFVRLLSAIGAKKDSALAEALEVTPQSVSDARVKKKVPPLWAIKIAEKYQVSLDWIMFGRGPMRMEGKLEFFGPVDEPDGELTAVPAIDLRLSAGHAAFVPIIENGIQKSFMFSTAFLKRKGQPAHMVLMTLNGNSMEPEIKDGDMVLIDQSQKDLLPDKIYAVGVEDLVYLKVVNTLPGKLILTSINKDYPTVELDLRVQTDSVQILGRAVWWCREA